MKREKKKGLSVLGGISLIAFLFAAGYIYVGFFSPDPYIMGKRPFVSSVVLWIMRLGIPLISLFFIHSFFRIKRKKLKISNFILLFVTIFFLLLLLYPAANYFYNRTFDMRYKTDLYHPYLQIAPPGFTNVDTLNEEQISIICLGGSTTEFKDSQDIGWPARMRDELRARLKRENIFVHNQGRQWYTTLHSLINYHTNLRQYKPNVLVIMHTINDLLHNADFSYFSHSSFRDDYGHFYGPVNRIIHRERLEQFVMNLLKHYWYHEPRKVIEQYEFPGAAPFEQNLNGLIDLAQSDGVEVVLMTQPSLYFPDLPEENQKALRMLNYEAIGPDKKWSFGSALRGFELYNSIVRKVARERQVVLVDLEQFIPKNLEYFYDDVHYQDKTFDIIAAKVAAELSELLKNKN